MSLRDQVASRSQYQSADSEYKSIMEYGSSNESIEYQSIESECSEFHFIKYQSIEYESSGYQSIENQVLMH